MKKKALFILKIIYITILFLILKTFTSNINEIVDFMNNYSIRNGKSIQGSYIENYFLLIIIIISSLSLFHILFLIIQNLVKKKFT